MKCNWKKYFIEHPIRSVMITVIGIDTAIGTIRLLLGYISPWDYWLRLGVYIITIAIILFYMIDLDNYIE
jgi:hypothetical protein